MTTSVPERPPLVILHGANGSGPIMQPLADALAPYAQTFTPDMLAHGGRPIPERMTIEDLANDVLAFCDKQTLAQTFVFGYSSGGSVALYLARHAPERILGVSTLAAKYVFDAATIARWTYLTDPARLGRPGNKRAAELTETHHPQDWIAVTSANRRLFEGYGQRPPLSEADYRAISAPALLFCSDADQLVKLDETVALGKLIPNARTVIFKGQCHPFGIVPTYAIAKAIGTWIGEIRAGASTSTQP